MRFGNVSVAEIITKQQHTAKKLTFANIWLGFRALIAKTPLPICGDVDLPTETLELDSEAYELLGAKRKDDGAELFGMKKKASIRITSPRGCPGSERSCHDVSI